MLQYEFMRTAFLVGILLGVVLPLIGSILVFKRLSMIGDALGHTALAGVAIGLIAGFNPLLGAIAISIVATLSIEVIRKKFPKYAEISLAIVMSGGIALSGLLSSFVPSNNFHSYLFGSIIAISSLEVFLSIGLFIVVGIFFIAFYKELMFIAYSESDAKLSGVPTRRVNFMLSLLTAIMIALASKIIGALIVSSMVVIPTAIAMQVAKSYRSTLLYAVLFSVVAVIIGLTSSFHFGLKPGSTISLITIIMLIFAIIIKEVIAKLQKKHTHKT